MLRYLGQGKAARHRHREKLRTHFSRTEVEPALELALAEVKARKAAVLVAMNDSHQGQIQTLPRDWLCLITKKEKQWSLSGAHHRPGHQQLTPATHSDPGPGCPPGSQPCVHPMEPQGVLPWGCPAGEWEWTRGAQWREQH